MESLCTCSGDTDTASLRGLPMALVSTCRGGTAGVLVSEERTSYTLLCETSLTSYKLNFYLELIA